MSPAEPEIQLRLGAALVSLRLWATVKKTALRELALSPLAVTGWHNLALAEIAGERPVAGELALQRALTVRPNFSSALLSAGTFAIDAGELARARLCFERANATAPRFAEAGLNLGLLDLLDGRYSCGWRGFAQRWACRSHAGFRWRPDAPRWLGSTLPSARLVLRAEPEQALGDTIQFARFIPDAASRVGEIVLECESALHRLMSAVPGVSQIVPIGADCGPADLTCGLMDLGQIFAAELTGFTRTAPYLRADAAQVEHWRSLLTDLARPWIGVCWRGNRKFRLDHRRSPGLAAMQSIFQQAEGGFVSLVHERREDEHLPDGVADPMPLITDMADTAALVSALDLVITSDTAVAHLAGALGRPTWILLHEPADWRWFRGRADSPWYPSVRLFRQWRPGDWSQPTAAVIAAMAGFAPTAVAGL
ncbi:MAG: hypothetical protein HYR63_23420 [Proteobacteria bacterium]|nr:hypothetical protein [Pseudomonadota bacterium]